jgi:hypothetical protein
MSNELVIDKDGKVAAVVIGVGGFLGIGEREVALDFKSLNIKYDPNAMTESGATIITVNATKDSLKSAPAWTWRTDTSAGGSSTAPRTTTPTAQRVNAGAWPWTIIVVSPNDEACPDERRARRPERKQTARAVTFAFAGRKCDGRPPARP